MNTQHKKVQNAAVAIVLSVGVVLSAFLTLFQVRAAGDETSLPLKQFVSQYTLIVKDSNLATQTYYLDSDSIDNPPQVAVEDGTELTLGIDLAVPDGVLVAGKTYSMPLPPVLDQGGSGTLTGDNGDFAEWKVTTTKTAGVASSTLTVTFNSHADDADRNLNRGGHFGCTSVFKASNIDADSHASIPFQIAAGTVLVPVDIYFTNQEPTLTKTPGSSNSLNSDGTITWNIDVNAGHNEVDSGLANVTVTDTFDNTDQQLWDGAGYQPVWGGTPVGKDDGSGSPTIPWYETSDNGTVTTVVFHLGDMAHDGDKVLTLTTKPIAAVPKFPASSVTYKNTAKLDADRGDGVSLTPVTDDGTVTVSPRAPHGSRKAPAP